MSRTSNNGGCLGLIVLVAIVGGIGSCAGSGSHPASSSSPSAPIHRTPTEEATEPGTPIHERLMRAARHLPPGASVEAITEQAIREGGGP